MTKEGFIYSNKEGRYVGHKKLKVFGKINCKSTENAIEPNIVKFHEVKDAIELGYRPCKVCHPMDYYDFLKCKELTSYETLEDLEIEWDHY